MQALGKRGELPAALKYLRSEIPPERRQRVLRSLARTCVSVARVEDVRQAVGLLDDAGERDAIWSRLAQRLALLPKAVYHGCPMQCRSLCVPCSSWLSSSGICRLSLADGRRIFSGKDCIHPR